MIRINNVKIPLNYNRDTLLKAAARELRTDPRAIKSVSLFRRSVDARKKEQIHFICSLDAEVSVSESMLLKKQRTPSEQRRTATRFQNGMAAHRRWWSASDLPVCLRRWFWRRAALVRLSWNAAEMWTAAPPTSTVFG